MEPLLSSKSPMDIYEVDEEARHLVFQKRIFNKYIPIGIIFGLIFSYFAYIYAYGVNVLFWDEWQFVPVYRELLQRGIRFDFLLKAQHNGNIMTFPYLLMFIVDFFSGCNNKILMFVGACFQVASFGLIWSLWARVHKTKNGYWDMVPCAFIMFSFCQYQNILWGFQTAWFMITFFSLAAFYFLDIASDNSNNPALFYKTLIFSLLCGIISSFSSTQGLLVWIAGFIFLFFKIRPKLIFKDRIITIWSIFGILCWVSYFLLQNKNDIGPQTITGGVKYAVLNPLFTIKFILSSLGAVVLGVSHFTAVLLGITLCIATVVTVYSCFHSSDAESCAFPLSLIIFGLFFDVMLAVGRGSFGIGQAFESHYTAYNLLLLVGLYLLFVNNNSRDAINLTRPMRYIFSLFLSIFLLVFIGLNTFHGISRGRYWRTAQFFNAYELLNLKNEPAFKIERTVFGNYDFILTQSQFLNSRYLNVFSDEVINFPPNVQDLEKPPQSYLNIETSFPIYRKALQRLWDVYTIAPDLQKVFPLRSPFFTKNLIRWAYGDAKDKGHYLHQYLDPYDNQYISLWRKLE